ncbi:MAG: hypothetical protein ABIJ09_14340 [Pseudomonadota bacterium]
MSGLWVFLIVVVVFGSVSSVLRAALHRGQRTASERELESLRTRMAEIEGHLGLQQALPAPERQRGGELERRVEALETIVTGADELLEKRLREASHEHAGDSTD